MNRISAAVAISLLLAACSDTAGKNGVNGTPNNQTTMSNNAVTNNDTAPNNATNSLPTGACPNALPLPEGATTCRSNDECTHGCGYVDSGPGCGAISTPGTECVEDADCGENRLCIPAFCEPDDVCCQGEGTQCVDACDITPCEDGFDCAEDGRCVPTPCTEGYECAEGFVCDPERLDAPVDEHGCTPEACVADRAPCPDGMQCDDGAAGNPTGTCVPIPCASDDDCEPNEVCGEPESIYRDGCTPADCMNDSDCTCGACVENQCQPRIFICLSPPAP